MLFGDFLTFSDLLYSLNAHNRSLRISMKTKTTIIFIGLVLLAAIAAGTVLAVTLSEQPNLKPMTPATIYVTEDQTGTTIHMKKGDLLNVTLQDYGDGGYTWTVNRIDTTLLRQDKQTNWGSSGMMGDFGKDTFMFTALKTGSTTLSLECKRAFGEQDVCKTLVVQLEIS
jgi:predicted secreted protein